MELQNILVRQARLVPFTTSAGAQSNFFELSLVHGQRPSTNFDPTTRQQVIVYDAQGKPIMKDDVLTLEYYGNEAATMQQFCQQNGIVPGCVVNLTLHSFNRQNPTTRRWATQWMMPDNVQIVSYPQQPAYQQPAQQQGYQQPAPQQQGYQQPAPQQQGYQQPAQQQAPQGNAPW